MIQRDLGALVYVKYPLSEPLNISNSMFGVLASGTPVLLALGVCPHPRQASRLATRLRGLAEEESAVLILALPARC